MSDREPRREKGFDQIFREYKRRSKEIMDEVKQKSHYKKPSELRREKINKAKRKKKKRGSSSFEINDKPFVD